MRKGFLAAIFLIMIIAVIGSEKVNVQKGQLSMEKISDLTSIPAEYGKLVEITSQDSYTGWAQLWFEDEENTIRIVRVSFAENRVHEDVTVIPRK